MNIQTINNFYYLNNIYSQPYFVVDYSPFIDMSFTSVNSYMYENIDSFKNGNSYLQSFGLDVSNEFIYNDALVTDQVIEFLKTISPTTIFVKEHT
jgi:hypothetical protein